MNDIKIFKIGGNVIDNHDALKRFLSDLARVEGAKILVHGGGKEASRLSEQLDIKPNMLNGRRITDTDTLKVVTMVYAGLINKRIVALLQSIGVDALGLTGADGNAVKAVMRSPIPVDYGFVGDISPKDVNTNLISLLLQNGILPVFSPIMHDKEATLLNCNADSVAAAIAQALALKGFKVTLTYCFEKEGVLADVDNPDSLIPLITPHSVSSLKDSGKISAGMIPKIDNAISAVKNGVQAVCIKSADNILKPIETKITL